MWGETWVPILATELKWGLIPLSIALEKCLSNGAVLPMNLLKKTFMLTYYTDRKVGALMTSAG